MKFKEFMELLESPQRMKGNAPFEDDEINSRVGDISKKIINLDYEIVKEKFFKNLDLYKHKTLHYYVLGTWYRDNKENRDKDLYTRFAIITDLSCDVEEKFRSSQKQLQSKKVLSISTIHTTKNWRGQGISSALYEYIVDSGYIIISDGIQYDGAVELWKKFPSVKNAVVYIYDSLEDKIISKYTSKTPESHIWSDDNSRRRIKLVFTKSFNI